MAIEPPVLEPRAAIRFTAATAAALPPELPPWHPLGVPGIALGPKAEVSVELPMANSSRGWFKRQQHRAGLPERSMTVDS